VNCGQDGDWLCFCCAKKIVPVVSQVCPECQKLSERGEYHKKCADNKSLKGILAAAYFEEGPVREMIHNLKYNGVMSLAEPLSELMVKVYLQCHSGPVGNRIRNLDPRSGSHPVEDDNFVVTFVPMHWRRQAQRGYNHAEVIARLIGKKIGIDVYDLLKKSKQTKRQAELSGNNRRKNLSGSFELKGDIDIKKAKIIIIDDVATTGSTLNECAAVLKTAGAKEVWGLVISRG
jgi:ComF family protein